MYSDVLALDEQIRGFPVPSHLQVPTDEDPARADRVRAILRAA